MKSRHEKKVEVVEEALQQICYLDDGPLTSVYWRRWVLVVIRNLPSPTLLFLVMRHVIYRIFSVLMTL